MGDLLELRVFSCGVKMTKCKGVAGHFYTPLHRAHFCLAVYQRSGYKHLTRILNVLILGAVVCSAPSREI